MRKVFSIVMYSDIGSNDRVKEEATYLLFVNYLEDIEEGTKYTVPITVHIVFNYNVVH